MVRRMCVITDVMKDEVAVGETLRVSTSFLGTANDVTYLVRDVSHMLWPGLDEWFSS